MLTPRASALNRALDQLVESPDDSDIVIRPEHDEQRGLTTWLLSRGNNAAGGVIAKMRITKQAGEFSADDFGVHPSRPRGG